MLNIKKILQIYRLRGLDAALKLINSETKASLIFRDQAAVSLGPNIIVRKSSGLPQYQIQISQITDSGEAEVQCVDVYDNLTDVDTALTGGSLTNGDVVYVTSEAGFYVITLNNNVLVTTSIYDIAIYADVAAVDTAILTAELEIGDVVYVESEAMTYVVTIDGLAAATNTVTTITNYASRAALEAATGSLNNGYYSVTSESPNVLTYWDGAFFDPPLDVWDLNATVTNFNTRADLEASGSAENLIDGQYYSVTSEEPDILTLWTSSVFNPPLDIWDNVPITDYDTRQLLEDATGSLDAGYYSVTSSNPDILTYWNGVDAFDPPLELWDLNATITNYPTRTDLYNASTGSLASGYYSVTSSSPDVLTYWNGSDTFDPPLEFWDNVSITDYDTRELLNAATSSLAVGYYSVTSSVPSVFVYWDGVDFDPPLEFWDNVSITNYATRIELENASTGSLDTGYYSVLSEDPNIITYWDSVSGSFDPPLSIWDGGTTITDYDTRELLEAATGSLASGYYSVTSSNPDILTYWDSTGFAFDPPLELWDYVKITNYDTVEDLEAATGSLESGYYEVLNAYVVPRQINPLVFGTLYELQTINTGSLVTGQYYSVPTNTPEPVLTYWNGSEFVPSLDVWVELPSPGIIYGNNISYSVFDASASGSFNNTITPEIIYGNNISYSTFDASASGSFNNTIAPDTGSAWSIL